MDDKTNACVWRRFVACQERDAGRFVPTPTPTQSNVATALKIHTAMSVLCDVVVRGVSGISAWDDVVMTVGILGAVVVALELLAGTDVLVNLSVHTVSHCRTRTELSPLRSNAACPDTQMMGVRCCKSPLEQKPASRN